MRNTPPTLSLHLYAVMHTDNPRQHPQQPICIISYAENVIKTGGEWISSIDLENAAVAHPAKEDILKFLEGKVPKWWVPDDVVFLDSLPVGGTGKVQKSDLRKQYGGVFS